MVRSAHLKDDRLVECYLAARTGEPLDPPVADHLSACLDCGSRYDTLVAFLDDLREDADEELDGLFPAERLAGQRDAILQRLDHVHRSARVITFPGRDVSPSPRASVRVAPRWLAAAAAAGLFIGVAVGGVLGPDRLHHVASTRMQVASAPAQSGRPGATPAVLVSSGSASPDDDAFLMELDVELERPHTRELQPFDAMTPHERDVDGLR
jgi:hypothetical protein